jgi:hypothetical protein
LKQKTEAEYQKWVEEQEAKLTGEERDAFKKLTSSKAGVDVFGGHLREADYYKRLNELTEERRAFDAAQAALKAEQEQFAQIVNEVDRWHQEEKPKNEKLSRYAAELEHQVNAYQERLKAVGLGADDPPATSREAKVTGQAEEELRKQIAELKQQQAVFDKAVPKVFEDFADVFVRLTKDGFEVDPRRVIQHAQTKRVDLARAYDELTADQRAKRATESREKELDKAREEGRREALAKIPAGAKLTPATPSILDALQSKHDPSSNASRVDAAVKSFLELGGS